MLNPYKRKHYQEHIGSKHTYTCISRYKHIYTPVQQTHIHTCIPDTNPICSYATKIVNERGGSQLLKNLHLQDTCNYLQLKYFTTHVLTTSLQHIFLFSN